MLVYQRVLFMIYHDLPIGPYLLAFMEASINQPARITSVEKKSCYHGAGWWLVEPAWNVFRKKSRGTTNLVHSGSSLNLHPNPKTMDTYGYHSVYAPGTGMFKLAFLVRLDISGHSRFGLSGTWTVQSFPDQRPGQLCPLWRPVVAGRPAFQHWVAVVTLF